MLDCLKKPPKRMHHDQVITTRKDVQEVEKHPARGDWTGVSWDWEPRELRISGREEAFQGNRRGSPLRWMMEGGRLEGKEAWLWSGQGYSGLMDLLQESSVKRCPLHEPGEEWPPWEEGVERSQFLKETSVSSHLFPAS